MKTMPMTLPKPRNVDEIADAPLLLEGRYGTREMCDIWGTDAFTYKAIMDVQLVGLDCINELYSGRIPQEYIEALRLTATFQYVNPDEIRRQEAKGGHDVIAIATAWGRAADEIQPSASSLINFLRTSADSTETAKAVRCRGSLEVYAESIENLRDILLEKSMEWIDTHHMDQTHLYDALPTVAGRPLSFYAEMLHSGTDFIKYVHDHSLIAKWADATGNHHSATSAGIDGIKLQKEYARKLNLRYMVAPAQIPGREFNADVIYALARTSGTIANLATNIAMGFGDDANLYTDLGPRRKGSGAMPHKDVKGGNRTVEEQAESAAHELNGKVTTALGTIKFRYGRDLSGSASDRLDIGASFKLCDHVARRVAGAVYNLGLNKDRSLERVMRTNGIVTAERVMTYLVDAAKVDNPMPREEAHDLMGQLATTAYGEKRPFYEVLSGSPAVTSRIDSNTLRELSDPLTFIGQSKEVIREAYDRYHGQKTFSGVHSNG